MRPLVALFLVGCPFVGEDRLAGIRDADGDGDPAEQFGGNDCDDGDPLVSSLMTEDWSNDIDDDCDGNAFDQDGDGYLRGTDCDDTDATVNVERTWYADEDGDGVVGATPYVACIPEDGSSADPGPDCDDQDPTVALVTLFRDADGDGYGDPATTTTDHCEPVEGWVPTSGDCDDTDPEQRPGASWHDDADGDGFGAEQVASVGCERPTGRITDDSDCDDRDASVHPGASGEQLHDGVDTDCDDGSELPELACGPTPIDVYPDDIQSRLSSGGDCQALVLHVDAARPVYGPIVLPDDARISLVGAPFEAVAFGTPIGGVAISGAPALLQIEKATFVGWDTAVAVGGGSVTLSEVLVDAGEVVRADALADELTIYDSVFSGVDLVYDPDWAGPGTFDDVLVERSFVASAVAPHAVLDGGRSSTTWRDLVIANSAATVSLLTVPVGPTGRAITIEDLWVQDSLGRALEAELRDQDALALNDITLVGNISVDRGLVAVTGSGGATLGVSGFSARQNTMEVFSGVLSDLREQAMFDFGPGTGTLQDVWLLGNVTGESWLFQGKGTGSNLLFAGTGERGFRFNGAMDHVTVVGFGEGVPSVDGISLGLRLSDAIVADLGTDFPEVLVRMDRVMIAPGSAVTCGPNDADCLTGVDPMLLRYDRAAPSELWDLRVGPDSPAIAPRATCTFAGTACDLGGLTPVNAPIAYADTDGDGMYDTWETQFFGDVASCGPAQNPDGDGYTNVEEFASGTLPTAADFDLDGLPDGAPDGVGGTWDDAPWDPSGG
ncbi:MAG: hypothetical protein H6735_01230 [Alphaproteobacteria bacterium]|nr:hypothetical protein [Alphaproteobacteria bacterium]